MTNIAQLIQSSVRRDTRVQPITVTRQLAQPAFLPTTAIPTSRGATTSPYITQLIQSSVRRSPTNATAGIGGTALRLPAGRSVISPASGDKTGVIPTSTLATQSAFGGGSGGMGASAAAPTALGPATLTGLGSSLSKMGVGVTNTLGSLIPLAIKVIIAVIVIKIVLWLIKRRR